VALGFRLVAEVYKQRRRGNLPWRGQDVEVALDHVDPLGHFIELELAADVASLDAAKAAIASLAVKLGLEHGERRSYLEMLLARS
jgi:predicted adenylyl cyclase CyaB